MRNASRFVVASICGLAVLAGSQARAGEEAKAGAIPPDKLPPAVRATIEKEAKAAAIRNVKIVYQAEFYVLVEDRRQKVEVQVDADGHLLQRRPNETLDMADVPDAVRALILAEPKGAEVSEVERRVRHGQTSYTAEMEDDHALSIRVDGEGKIIYARCEMPFGDAPDAVKAAVHKRAPDAEIDMVDRVTAEGRTAYRGEFDLNGRNVSFEVDPNGTILRWDVEEEEDDEDEGDEPEPPIAPAPPKAPDAHML